MKRSRNTSHPRAPRIAAAEVLYEDDQLLVVNKPAGVATTADRSDSRRSLHDAVLDHVQSNAPASMRVRPINQLDRLVSGLVVFAKSKRVETMLETLFRKNNVRRVYCAVVRGTFDAGDGAEGTVQSSITDRDRRPRRNEPLPASATPAVTHYRVLRQGDDAAIVQLRPETHRKDQLFTHMRQIGHPIIGDAGPRSRGTPAPLLLHLEQITFEHPRTGRDVSVIAPKPPDFDRALGENRLADRAQKSKPKADAKSTSWEPVAEWYTEYHSTAKSDHFADVIHPGALDLLGDLRGRRVLDVACGEGTFASLLVQRGARVVGVDAARGLVERARSKQIRNAAFVEGDASRLDDLADDTSGPFDAASCIMALMNIADLDATLSGIAARLTPGSPLVGVIIHPAFRSPKRTSWGWDTSDRDHIKQYRRVDAYLSESREPITMNPGQAAHGKAPIETYTFHRPISRYVHALASTGFAVQALDEWPSTRRSQPGPRADEENRARSEFPLFLGIRAVRVARTDD